MGRNVDIKNDQNKSEFVISSGKKLLGIKTPTSIDLEKSGLGKNKSPPTNPKIIDI